MVYPTSEKLDGELMKMSGFTIIELIIVLTITAILSMMAVPSFKTMLDSSMLSVSANTMISHLMYARSEAIKRGSRVILCKANNGLCTTSGGYEQGWIIFADLNNSNQLDNEEVILSVHEKTNGYFITGEENLKDFVAFASMGSANNISQRTDIIISKDVCIKQKVALALTTVGHISTRRIHCN